MSGYHCFSAKPTMALKRHRCIWCGEHIEPGENYLREKSVYDGQHQNHAWHHECHDAAQEDFRSGDCEFTPYQADRPQKEQPK